ncbi:MAG: YezD family protein [Deltaproteobacteria bacterium]|jgi:hypothetical protein|nr:YezD family protein [Deltaproteobacteria bacterium]
MLRRAPLERKDAGRLKPAPDGRGSLRILKGIINLLKGTYHGQIVIINQNYRIVQVERKENFNPEELQDPVPGFSGDLSRPEQIEKRISEALEGLEFGQVILIVKKGQLAQIERLEKVRLADVQGLGGDGI